jgi:hypothetical protein
VSNYKGFPTADVSTSYLDDAKMRALWRLLRDPALMRQAVTVHLSTLLMSWREGERVTAEAALPWWDDESPEVVAALMDAGLFDAERRIPEHAFAKWLGQALQDQLYKNRARRLGGLRAHGMSQEDAIAELDRRVREEAALKLSLKAEVISPALELSLKAGSESGSLPVPSLPVSPLQGSAAALRAVDTLSAEREPESAAQPTSSKRENGKSLTEAVLDAGGTLPDFASGEKSPDAPYFLSDPEDEPAFS